MLGGADAQATPGDLIRLGMGVPHGIFNKSDQTAKVLFWVSPTQKLYDLFWGIHNMKEQTPDAVVALAANTTSTSCRRPREREHKTRGFEVVICERSEAIQKSTAEPWIASSLRSSQ